VVADLSSHLVSIAAERVPLWIDAWRYGERLLNKGQPAPWDDVGMLASFTGRLQSLVSSDVFMVEVASFYDHWLQRHPALLQAMAEKRRLGYPLRTLLADQGAREELHQIVEALSGIHGDVPLVLAMPSPRCWMALACCQARGLGSVEVNWDDAESAAMYLADYLRVFADCQLSGVLLRDLPGEGPADASEAARYQPVVNVARHYQWCVVLDSGVEGGIEGCNEEGLLFLGSPIGGLSALRVTDVDALPELPGDFGARYYCHVQVPEDGNPERVLECLQELRGSTG
jgi:hypothetical protein